MAKQILVTGANSGLGAAIVDSFDQGNDVIARPVLYPDYDLAKPETASELHENFGDMDGIVNCAGINLIEKFEFLSIEEAKHVSEVNVWGGVRLIQEFLPGLEERQGVVCNIVSNAWQVPMTHSLAYNVSKAGFYMATIQLARELAGRDVTVFGIAPSKIAGTEMSAYIEERVPRVRGWTAEEAEEYQKSKLLSGEIDKKVLAEFITWLMSDRNRTRYLKGCVIPYGYAG